MLKCRNLCVHFVCTEYFTPVSKSDPKGHRRTLDSEVLSLPMQFSTSLWGWNIINVELNSLSRLLWILDNLFSETFSGNRVVFCCLSCSKRNDQIMFNLKTPHSDVEHLHLAGMCWNDTEMNDIELVEFFQQYKSVSSDIITLISVDGGVEIKSTESLQMIIF